MAKKKIRYYDIKNVLSTGAQYIMLLGQRANGKSYQAKKTVLTKAYKTGEKFVYLRRYREDIKQKSVKAYFEDMPITEITRGEWQDIEAYAGSIYFSRWTEEGKKEKSAEIGRYCSLNEYERYKSQMFVNFTSIVYEEFITDAIYLNDEPRLLQQFVSTVARHEKITVILVGNTLSRVCPYFNEWCLDGVLKQKIGTIEIYHFHVGESVIDIAVEYCTNANAENKMFFGQTAKQIVSGEWETHDVPKLPRNQDDYECVYEVMVEYQAFKFVMQLLIEPEEGGRIVFVYPYTGHRYIHRLVTLEFSDKPNVNCILDPRRRAEELMLECFKLNKVCYSDNLTGSDFSHVNDAFKIGNLVN